MIDFFGRKARAELDEAKAANANLQYRLEQWESMNYEFRLRELADIIRENDQLIYQMAMKATWPEQRPIFNKLQEGQESRMRAESNRVNDIMKKELIEVYGGKLVTNTKRLESK